MNEILKINNLNKSFSDFSLRNVSLSLPKGYIMGLVGPNGAGKTTMINLILNILHKDSGEIEIFGLDNQKNKINIKGQIGVVFDSLFFPETWSIRLIEKNMKNFYDNWDTDGFHNLLERFSLSPKQKAKELSKGMKMKLMLASALSHNAKLLILDEPTSGLDPLSRAELLEVLRDYIEDGEKSVIFSTHITTDLEKIADYITFLDKGEVIFSGEKDVFTSSYRMVRGGTSDLTQEVKNSLLGFRQTSLGFEGLALSNNLQLYQNCIIEPATIDEIIIYSSKGGTL